MNLKSVNGRQLLHLTTAEMSARNLARVTSGIPTFLRNLLVTNAVWIAGGALRSSFDKTPVADFDLFFRSSRYVDRVEAALKAFGAKQVFKCPEGKLQSFVIGSAKIQLITPRFYTTVFDLVGSFDFTVCQFAFDGEYVTLGRDGLHDAKYKRLRVQKLEYPVATLNRIGKYRYGKGYWMSEEDWGQVIKTIQGQQFRPEALALYID